MQLELDGQSDRLRYRAPKGAVADLLPDIARFKPSLLERLEAERTERAAFLAGADFRAWHWTACGAPWSIGFYSDWKQFARLHCSRPGGVSVLAALDVVTVARFVFADKWRDLARRVANHLTGHDLNTSALETWARAILESEPTP